MTKADSLVIEHGFFLAFPGSGVCLDACFLADAEMKNFVMIWIHAFLLTQRWKHLICLCVRLLSAYPSRQGNNRQTVFLFIHASCKLTTSTLLMQHMQKWSSLQHLSSTLKVKMHMLHSLKPEDAASIMAFSKLMTGVLTRDDATAWPQWYSTSNSSSQASTMFIACLRKSVDVEGKKEPLKIN